MTDIYSLQGLGLRGENLKAKAEEMPTHARNDVPFIFAGVDLSNDAELFFDAIIPNAKSTISMNLSNCNLAEADFTLLFSKLKKRCVLGEFSIKLNVSYNEVTDAHIDTLLAMLKANNKLIIHISLEETNVTDKKLLALQESENITLEQDENLLHQLMLAAQQGLNLQKSIDNSFETVIDLLTTAAKDQQQESKAQQHYEQQCSANLELLASNLAELADALDVDVEKMSSIADSSSSTTPEKTVEQPKATPKDKLTFFLAALRYMTTSLQQVRVDSNSLLKRLSASISNALLNTDNLLNGVDELLEQVDETEQDSVATSSNLCISK